MPGALRPRHYLRGAPRERAVREQRQQQRRLPPDCRGGTVRITRRCASRPVAGCISNATSTTCRCHGISFLPSAEANSATSGPQDRRSGRRSVPNRGLQTSDEPGEVVKADGEEQA